ncbi:uncharacterized protein [Epargyreus clarus]|uniref:uncharacterized protein n=1 Tax=Epargyreus clarus TaxID=520877 RepID=UPI003C2CA164
MAQRKMQSRYQFDLHPSENLLQNVVDKEFQNLLTPFYFLTMIFCLRKYDLRDNYVTPNTKRDLVTCALGMFIAYMLLFCTLRYFATVFDTSTVFAMYLITYVQYAINYTILCFLNVIEGKLNVDVLLILHQINKSLQSSADDRKLKYLSWMSTSGLLVVYFLLVFFKLLLDPLWNWSRATFIATTLIFDLELLYIVFIAYFLACKTDTWRQMLQEKRMYPENVISNENEEIELDEKLLKFEMIINALELTKKSSRWTILFHFVIAFTQALAYFEILILWIKNNSADPKVTSSHLYGVILWVFKSLITETFLCITCEVLYRRIAAAQVEVILYLAYHPSCTVRRFKKNFFRLSKIRLEMLSPWGIFSVDAALPLRMVALLANYIIVLLQFAFL